MRGKIMNKIFDNLGLMLDCSRNAVMRPEMVKKMIDLTSKMGYDFIMLYTEDTYEVNNQPYFGHFRGRYSKEELKELADYAQNKNMELIPCIQTLAHIDGLLKWNCYHDIIDCDDILLVGNERVYELIDGMFATISECFNTKTVHIGMDEAEFVGLGKYLKINGYRADRTQIILEHLNKVSKIADKYDFNLLMWGDMFYKLAGPTQKDDGTFTVDSTIKEKIPSNVTLVYWDYYSKDSKNYDNCFKVYNQIEENLWFAGGTWTWTGFAPHMTHTENVTSAAIDACKNNNIRTFLTTLWGDDGGECSMFAALPNLYWLSENVKGNTDKQKIKNGFKEFIGIDYDEYKLLELPNTPNTDGDINNPDKYMLYNDLLMGRLDSTVNGDEGARYAECSKILSKISIESEYSYLFDTLKALCDVLAVKYDLGVKIREAYKSKNLRDIKHTLNLVNEVRERVDVFYNAYERQWFIENKPQGFDVFSMRIGALLQRIKYTANCLKKLIDGETDRIEELEEVVLDITCCNSEKKAIFYPFWDEIVSSNVINMRRN